MNYTQEYLLFRQKLGELDPDTVVDMLNISSKELIDNNEDKVMQYYQDHEEDE